MPSARLVKEFSQVLGRVRPDFGSDTQPAKAKAAKGLSDSELCVATEVRNFSWNFAFFEWKRFLHNAVDNSPANAPAWFEAHLNWLRSRSLKTSSG